MWTADLVNCQSLGLPFLGRSGALKIDSGRDEAPSFGFRKLHAKRMNHRDQFGQTIEILWFSVHVTQLCSSIWWVDDCNLQSIQS